MLWWFVSWAGTPRGGAGLFYCGLVCVCVCVVDREWLVVCESHQEETHYTVKYTRSCSVCVDMSVVVVLGHECAANARLFVSFIYGE